MQTALRKKIHGTEVSVNGTCGSAENQPCKNLANLLDFSCDVAQGGAQRNPGKMVETHEPQRGDTQGALTLEGRSFG